MNRNLIVITAFIATSALGAAERDPNGLARRIDTHIEAHWKRENIRPANRSDDAEFLRRVYLDLSGRIPSVAEARSFLADKSPGKREKLIDQLLTQPGYAVHFARVWRQHWLPQSAAQFEELKPEFEEWLRTQLKENVPYDRMMRSLLAPSSRATGRSAQVFLQANEYKPANLAGGTARIFLGLNLDCAQCHNHPFARWTKDQFWEFAAFFPDPTEGGKVLRITPPNSKKELSPRFVDGSEPKWTENPTALEGRAVLVDWLASKKNPYFARNAVNRIWSDFFGTGLVEPLDDLSGAIEPSHPELLNDLAEAFTESGYDLRYLIRALARTRAYQLASAGTSAKEPQHYARFAVRAMSGDQFFESIVLAAGVDPKAASRSKFLARFNQTERPAISGRTILQSLELMNGETLTTATSLTGRGTLAAAAESPFLDTPGRVEILFLAAFSRFPHDDERKRFVTLIDSGGASADPKKSLASLFWVLLNSNEFSVIH